MKKSIFFERSVLILVTYLCLSFNLNAQTKVEQNGRVIIGPELVNQDPYEVVSLHVLGKNGSYRSGGKLAFGDFGQVGLNSWNVFIGEYDATDTDQLWLHGKNGTYFSHTNGIVWGYYDLNIANRFNFNCDVYSSGIMLTSDEKMKENIRPLTGSLSSLKKLNGVTYSLKKPFMRVPVDMEVDKRDLELSEKNKNDLASLEKWEKEMLNSKDMRIGFVAQEIKKIFPELVSEDKDGMLSVDYIGLIPIIVESIKEQQIQIEALRNEIEKLKK